MYFQPVFQSCSEVMGDRKVWGQSETCNLQGLIDGMGVRGSLPAGSLPAGWLEKLRQVGRVLGVFPGVEDLENGLPCQVGCHSPPCLLGVFSDCVSVVR